jgi:hypothetical protein
MQAKDWMLVMTALEVDPHLTSTWMMEEECDGKASKYPGSALCSDDTRFVPLHLTTQREFRQSIILN